MLWKWQYYTLLRFSPHLWHKDRKNRSVPQYCPLNGATHARIYMHSFIYIFVSIYNVYAMLRYIRYNIGGFFFSSSFFMDDLVLCFLFIIIFIYRKCKLQNTIHYFYYISIILSIILFLHCIYHWIIHLFLFICIFCVCVFFLSLLFIIILIIIIIS